MVTVECAARRRRELVAAALVVACLGAWSRTTAAGPAKPSKGVPRIIIDTDLSRWWDDATAMGIANVLDERGEIKVLGIVSDVPNANAVAAIDAIDTAYGHPNLPLGAAANSAVDTFVHGYTDVLTSKLPHSVQSSNDVPSAVHLYRRLLAKQPNHSTTIVSIGGYTNLAGLLDSKAGQGSKLTGRRLITKKVKRLVIMDGLFPVGIFPVTNQLLDLAAANRVVEAPGWPTPIAWVDGLDGVSTRVGGQLCTTVPADHPMRIVFEALFGCGPPKDGDWDAPTLLYAVGDNPALFTELGQGGAAVINDQGGLSWQDNHPTRKHDVYVHLADQQALNKRIDELLAAK
jgi:hypothetical protein